MSKYLVAVLNGTKARLLTLEPAEFPESESSPRLRERLCCSNTAASLAGKELWANTKTGRNRGAAALAHSYDDHREAHVVKWERQFASDIAKSIVDLIEKEQVKQLILIAEPHSLGLMREVLASKLPRNLKVNELAKALCHLKPHQLQDYLARAELLPAAKRAAI